MEGLIRISPDKRKANSILSMADTTLEMIDSIDRNRFPSNVTKEYYGVAKELIIIILLLDGYKTGGEGAHKKLIEYLELNYKQFSAHEIALLESLRITRNKIAYDGFFVRKDFLSKRIKNIQSIISKLRGVVKEKLD